MFIAGNDLFYCGLSTFVLSSFTTILVTFSFVHLLLSLGADFDYKQGGTVCDFVLYARQLVL